jgi:hypothetical protein
VFWALVVAFLDLSVGLSVILVAYRDFSMVYYMSSVWAIVAIIAFICLAFVSILGDLYDVWQQPGGVDCDERFGARHASLFVGITSLLCALTVVAILDARAG